MAVDSRQQLVEIGAGGGHLDTMLLGENGAQPLPYEQVVIRQDDAHLRHRRILPARPTVRRVVRSDEAQGHNRRGRPTDPHHWGGRQEHLTTCTVGA